MFRNMRALLFKEAAMKYMETRRKDLRPTSYASYLHLLEKRIIPEVGNIKIKKFCEKDLQFFVTRSQESGYSKHGTRDCVSIIKLVLKHGSKMGWCAAEPMEVTYSRENKKSRNRSLPDDDFKMLMNYCLAHPSKRTLPTLIAMTTGLRIGEVCALQYGDIDLENLSINISKSVKRVCTPHEKSFIEVSEPKTSSSVRTVPLLPGVSEAISKSYLGESVYISSGNDVAPLEPRTYRQKYSRLLKLLGLKPYTFHDLRHTFASRCINSGADARTVADILGHTTVEMTLNTYTHSNSDRKRQVMESACISAT